MSEALRRFTAQTSRADGLLAAATAVPLSLAERQIFYHASIAAWVAAWDTFLNAIIVEAITQTGSPLSGEVQAIKLVLLSSVKRVLEKFNTPNFDSARDVVLLCTAWDPIAFWSWPAKGMTWQQVKERLNQVLKVRHSFAHGAPLPVYSWLPNSGGASYLNKEVVREVHSLISHLARTTDAELKRHMKGNYGVFNDSNW